MGLSAGTKLGPYEIVAPLGSGGMGEVYRARDERLGRSVAIKVLPASFTGDPDRLRRFDQEARAVAALNHPNILAVHDTGLQDGVQFIVMELLDGKTLREMLQEGPMPVRKALTLFQHVANGLAAAHDKRIVHRDLKPENIFITKDGRAKILDFGLAKQNTPLSAAETISGTGGAPHTETGAVMGTVGYMSPEQVRGEATDHRSDVFALGAILYEMLSGKRAFKRDTHAETMTAILKDEPPELTASNPSISPGIDRIVRRCLEKQPEQRFQSVADLGFAIESLSGATTASSAIVQQTKTSKRSWYPAAVAGALVIALAAGWFAHSLTETRASVPTFQRLTYRRGNIYSARLSSDGSSVIYSADWGGGATETYIVNKEFPESRPLLKDGLLLSVSSTGELAVLTSPTYLDHEEFVGTLATMTTGGSAPREILKDVTAADWSPDGQSLAVVHVVAGKYRLEYPLGTVRFETSGTITKPRVARDGKRIAFLYHPQPGDDRGSVMLLDADGKTKTLSDGWLMEHGLAWTPSGDAVWFSADKSGGELVVYEATVSGRNRAVLAGAGGQRVFDIAPNGKVLLSNNEIRYEIYASINGAPQLRLSWMDISFQPSLSIDGKHILFSNGGGPGSKYYLVTMRNTEADSALTNLGEGTAYGFSPDGAWAWVLVLKDPPEVRILPTGPGEMRKPENSNIETYVSMGWLPDSRHYLFDGNESGHGPRVYMQDMMGGKAEPVTPEGFSMPFNSYNIPISPDGKRFVVFEESARMWRICAVAGGACVALPGAEEQDLPLAWSADNHSIFVSQTEPTSAIIKIDLATGNRQIWKEVNAPDPVGAKQVLASAITPDGKSYASSLMRRLDTLYVASGLN
ncbi:MAG TPA: protein kinase [Candidatus Acidoferrum sp.]|nr:protein kinase [Candidatus Acidoferrum sp.]